MGRFLAVCSVLVFTACVQAVPAQACGDSAPGAKAANHLRLEGVPKFAEVSSTLYRGGQPSREGFANLARFGINIIVDNGRSEKNKKLAERLGMRYVSIPWVCPFPKDVLFARFLKLVQDNPGKKIFVHCRFGDARTGMMIAAYRMKVQGLDRGGGAQRDERLRIQRSAHHGLPGPGKL